MQETEFNQTAFLDEVFAFLKRNFMTIRDFCKLAQCSPSTLYRGYNVEKYPMRAVTIRKFRKVMADNDLFG